MPAATYGSVDNPSSGNENKEAEEEQQQHFQETNLLYYKGRTLSQQEKTAKLIKIAVPIVIAILLIGGLAWFLLGDFGHLYPGPSGAKQPGYSYTISSPAATPPTSSSEVSSKSHSGSSSSTTSSEPAPAPKDSSHSSSGAAACSAHSACSTLGLVGECCPTSSGTMLECCS